MTLSDQKLVEKVASLILSSLDADSPGFVGSLHKRGSLDESEFLSDIAAACCMPDEIVEEAEKIDRVQMLSLWGKNPARRRVRDVAIFSGKNDPRLIKPTHSSHGISSMEFDAYVAFIQQVLRNLLPLE